MRFIVDIYRSVIIGLCGVVLILGAMLLFWSLDPAGPFQGEYRTALVAGAFFVAMLFIMSIGALAVMLSAHDRHAEMADHTAEMSDALHRIAASLEASGRSAQP